MQKSGVKGTGKDGDSSVAATAATMLVLGQPPPTAPHNNQLLTIEWSMMDKSRFIPLSMLSSFSVRCLLYPLTLVKTRIQVQKRNGSSDEYRGLVDACRRITKEEGVKGLYRGFWVGAFQVVSGVGYIATYESVRHALTMGGIRDGQVKALAGGGCASLVGQTIVVPSDVVSQHLMMLRSRQSSKQTPQSGTASNSNADVKHNSENHKHWGTNNVWTKGEPHNVVTANGIKESRLGNESSDVVSRERVGGQHGRDFNSFPIRGEESKSTSKNSTSGYGYISSRGTPEENWGGRGSGYSTNNARASNVDNGGLLIETQGRTRFQITADIVKQIYARDGFRGFYRGYGASLCTYVPNSALWWSFYHFYQDKLSALLPPWVSHLFIQCISGTLGGFTTTIITNPVDIVRARLQVQRLDSMHQTFQILWSEEGMRMFTKGLSARLVQSAVFSSSIILAYESIKRISVKDEYRHLITW